MALYTVGSRWFLSASFSYNLILQAAWKNIDTLFLCIFCKERNYDPATDEGDFSFKVNVRGNDEIAELAQAFNSMAQPLSSQESSRRSFVANVSHELKTPMTSIGGFIDGILDGTISEDKHD